jgi:Arc/MetJ family transcription regulator
MRTNIDIDGKLLAEAMEALGLKTKKATVEEALRRIVQIKRQAEIRKYRGKFTWTGDLEAMRLD